MSYSSTVSPMTLLHEAKNVAKDTKGEDSLAFQKMTLFILGFMGLCTAIQAGHQLWVDLERHERDKARREGRGFER